MRFVIKSVSSLQKAICRRINYLHNDDNNNNNNIFFFYNNETI